MAKCGALGCLPGIYAGGHLAARIADRVLLPILAGILMLIGLRLIAVMGAFAYPGDWHGHRDRGHVGARDVVAALT
jgi:hypothetical protein